MPKGITIKRVVIVLTALLSAAALVLLGALLYRAFTGPAASPIPDSITSDLTFSPFVVPKDNEDFTTKSYKLGSENSDAVPVFSYIVTTVDGQHSITVSQYTQPAEYSDIPEYKTQFLSNIAKQYTTVQSANGTIYLGRQSKQENKQLAIMLERGLLVFFAPTTGDVDEATWRKLGDALELQKI